LNDPKGGIEVKAYKGFTKDMKCKDFQYEIGKSYETDKKVKCCESGFHSCENPMDVLSYYPPADSRYCEAEVEGNQDREEGGDSKVCSSKISIKTEIGIKGIVKAGFDFIMEKIKNDPKTQKAYNDSGHAASQGYYGHAASQGYYGHAASQGNSGHAASQGYSGHAASQGNYGHAASQGNSGHAETHGKNAIAASFGVDGMAKSEKGSWIVCAEWMRNANGRFKIKDVKSAKVDGKKIKADTWYQLKDGNFCEVK